MPKKKAPAKKAAATVKKENAVSAASESTKSTATKEESKSPAVEEPNSISLALRQVGQEAAQKAKDVKKKGLEAISSAGKPESAAEKKEGTSKTEAEKGTPTPILVDTPKKELAIEDTALMQSPTSTAWKRAPGGHIASMLAEDKSESSAKSIASMQQGSEVSQASKEEIKQVEEDCKIVEENKDAVEN